MKVVFVSRGRGYGHAMPDLAVAQLLQRHADLPVDVLFVSYAAGAELYRVRGADVIDIGEPEDNQYLATFMKLVDVFTKISPDAVISHEEFAALPAEKMCGVHALYISDWLPPVSSIFSESLNYASSLTIFERPGVFPVPPWQRDTVRYLGPMVRDFDISSRNRLELRSKLGIPGDAFVISVCPGGSITELHSPIAKTVLAAFRGLDCNNKRLFWFSRRDYHHIRRLAIGFSGAVEAIPYSPEIEHWMAASDVVITKGTRVTIVEAAKLGVPTVTISHGSNPMDDLLAVRISSNEQLNASAVTEDTLRQSLERYRVTPPSVEPRTDFATAGEVAKLLWDDIKRLCSEGCIEASVRRTA